LENNDTLEFSMIAPIESKIPIYFDYVLIKRVKTPGTIKEHISVTMKPSNNKSENISESDLYTAFSNSNSFTLVFDKSLGGKYA